LAKGVVAMGVDFDPDLVRTAHLKGLPVHYGDAEDPDFLDALPLKQASWVVSTLPQAHSNLALLHALKTAGYTGRVAIAARDDALLTQLPEDAVHDVFHLFEDAVETATDRLCATVLRAQPNTN
jgi:voltage-gated potassium channel Kch